MNENKKKSYTAPKMEATSFRTEQGYATTGGTQAFTNVNVGFKP